MPDSNINAPDSKSDVTSFSPPGSGTKPKIYPLKPEKPEGFKKAVAWFGGRELIASLKGVVMYAIYGENMDPRSWMKPNIYPNVEEKIHYQKVDQIEKEIKKEVDENNTNSETSNAAVKIAASEEIKKSDAIQEEITKKVNKEWAKKVFDYWNWKRTHFGFWRDYLKDQDFWKKLYDEENQTEVEEKSVDEFWFDYIADSGDGQMGVYGVGCICLSDLWLENELSAAKDTTPSGHKKGEKNDPPIKFAPPSKADRSKYTLLPRGYFLFVGGDTAYHSANYATLFERFQTPFRWAFTSVRKFLFKNYIPTLNLHENKFCHEGIEKPISTIIDGVETPDKHWDGTISGKTEIPVKSDAPGKNQSNIQIIKKKYWDTEPPRPFFGVPANHDYYDSIDGFNRQFRRPPFDDIEENMIYEGNKGKSFLQIPSFARQQEASYIAIRLPFDWWMFGIDSENEKLDFRQEVFFRQIMEKKPKKLILATPEPTTVFGKKSVPAEKTTTYLKTITDALEFEQPFLSDGKLEKLIHGPFRKEDLEGFCRLDLSGDVHHYARYWGENTRGFKSERFASNNYASLVSGGGGAFFDVTSTLLGKAVDENGQILLDENGKKALGEIPPQKLYPSEEESISHTADKIFDLRNIKKGGYIQYGGVIFATLIFFFLTQFSNVRDFFINFEQSIKTRGFRISEALPTNLSGFLTDANGEKIVAGMLLALVVIFAAAAAASLNKLIKKIKEKSSEENIDKKAEEEMLKLGRIKKLLITSMPFFFAVALYVLFITTKVWAELKAEGFTNSLLLLAHIVIAVLLVWLSFEYTNWLAIRFKLSRRSAQKTFTEMFEDPNENADHFITKSFSESDYRVLKYIANNDTFPARALRKIFVRALKILGRFSRAFSYKYFPANAAVGLAVATLIFGVGNFGDADLSRILADLTLVLVVVGVFVLLTIVLASATGAAYQDKKGKNRFLLIGFWHAILQLFTAFVLYYYANWKVVLGVFALVTVLNGFSYLTYKINSYLNDLNEDEITGWRKILQTIVNFRLAAELMKKGKSQLTAAWVICGLIILLAPFAFLYFFPGSESLNQAICRQSVNLNVRVRNLSQSEAQTLDKNVCRSPDKKSQTFTRNEKYAFWTYITLSLLIIGFIGYRMSRVWFSWYLGVSVLFNGHNNEAGGMARIEDFKQILRIKVTNDKLTVFVIGLDTARPDLDEKLTLKLVDKFELSCTKAPEIS